MKGVVTQGHGVQVVEMSVPELKPKFVLVDTEYSAISPGTELMMQGLERLLPVTLGYSAVGIVREVGEGISHVAPGDRVACYGAPYVRHAEVLAVPGHLAIPLSPHVDAKEAALVGLGAIAIHALRQADLQFGEHAVVVGLGILGNLIAQIADTAALQVYACDIIPERCRELKALGLTNVFTCKEQLEKSVMEMTNEYGADAVILCAGGKGSGLIDDGLSWVRDRGKIVVVGDLSVECDRTLMFKKEAELRISRAGGPGRGDKGYEVDGHDYPIGFARWTEGRNMAEYIRLLEGGKIAVSPLISGTVALDHIAQAYRKLAEAPQHTLGLVVTY